MSILKRRIGMKIKVSVKYVISSSHLYSTVLITVEDVARSVAMPVPLNKDLLVELTQLLLECAIFVISS